VGEEYTRIEVKRNAAGRLARLAAKDSAAQYVVLLLFDDRPYGMEGEPEMIRSDQQAYERAVDAAVINNLPHGISEAVLLAIAAKLTETGRGHWSGHVPRVGRIVTQQAEFASPPIRQLAREYLKTELGVDHGWDIGAWRKEILRR